MGGGGATDERVRVSKLLALWLRHDPGAGGLVLDRQGWAAVPAVLGALGRALSRTVTREELAAVVATSEKRRFTLESGRIRANQGHSLDLDLAFTPVTPPVVLFHGTTLARWGRIQETGGLARMARHHVHLSADRPTALQVARRHRGQTPLVLRVAAGAMHAAGHTFFHSANGVYLVDAVPLQYLAVDTVAVS